MDIKQNVGIRITESVTITDPTNNKSIDIKPAKKERKRLSDETKQRMRVAKLGVPKSPEHREKLRIGRLRSSTMIAIGHAFVVGGITFNRRRVHDLERNAAIEKLEKIIPGLADHRGLNAKYWRVALWLLKEEPILFVRLAKDNMCPEISFEDFITYLEGKYAVKL